MKIKFETSKEPERELLGVLIATPFGRGGMGGIDRLMDAVQDELEKLQDEKILVRILPTRGKGGLYQSPLLLTWFIVRMVVAKVLGRVDLVHLNLSQRGSTYRKVAIAGIAHKIGVPFILHLNGSAFDKFVDNSDGISKAVIKNMFERAEKILVVGNFWKSYISSFVPQRADRIIIIPNSTAPIHLQINPSPEETVRIVFLGLIGDRKGIPQLLEALAANADLEDWSAVLAGNGEVEETKAKLKLLGLSDRVTVPGWVGPDAVASYLSNSDILVLPSLEENLPVSVVEGMAAGLAVIATPVGAVEDIIVDGITGLLVQPGDAGELAAALRRLLQDEKLRLRLGQAAHNFHQQNLEIGPYVNKLLEIWRLAAQEKGRL